MALVTGAAGLLGSLLKGGAAAGAAKGGGLLKGAAAAGAGGGGKKGGSTAAEGSQLAQQQNAMPGPAQMMQKLGSGGPMPQMQLPAMPAPSGNSPMRSRSRASVTPFASSRPQSGRGLLAEYLEHRSRGLL